MNKVRSESPLKNKIDDAQQKLQFQVSKLGVITEKLQKKQDVVFHKIVEAQRANNHTYARAYAIELAEIRKMNNMVSNAKLSMEQIQIRLNTVSELGDIVVTLSPCMSIIKGLGTSIGGIMPEAAASMQDLSNVLGNVLSQSSIGSHDAMITNDGSAETIAILEEAHAVIKGQTQNSIPEVPIILQQRESEEKESIT